MTNEKIINTIKKLAMPVLVLLFLHTPAHAKKSTLELGFAFYVGGLHILDSKADLTYSGGKYNFVMNASTRGFMDLITRFVGRSTSSGRIFKNESVKAKFHTNTSYSYFGENYSELKMNSKGATLKIFPSKNIKALVDLPGNPLKKANDPVATIINIMSEVGRTKKCAKNIIVIANHFIYKIHVIKAKTVKLENQPDYNVADGDALRCTLDFERLDKQDDLSAYSNLGGTGDGKGRLPVIYFKKLDGIPFYLPVLIKAKEETFGEFRMHLQYVKFGKTVYRTDLWEGNETFTKEKVDKLNQIPKKFGAK